MQNIKHIHEVIFLIKQNNGVWTPDELITAIGDTWGNDIQFGSCSGTAFHKEHALSFLLHKQKVMLTADDKVVLHPSMQICNGHEEFQAH